MQGRSRKHSDVAITRAQAGELEGVSPPAKMSSLSAQVIGLIASRKNAGRDYAPAFFLGECAAGREMSSAGAARTAFISARNDGSLAPMNNPG